MAEHGGALTPGEAAKRLAIASSTLRVYSVKLAEALSAEAGRPVAAPDGRPGVRRYSVGDVRVLEQAKELLGRGLTYEQVAEELRGRRPRPGLEEGRRARRARTGAAADLTAVLEPLRAALQQAMAATEAWQQLAEERQREVDALRARLRELEPAGAGGKGRPSWWQRLLGGG